MRRGSQFDATFASVRRRARAGAVIGGNCTLILDPRPFVPVSIVIGFTNGIALLIALSQLKDLLGLKIDKVPADFFAQVNAIVQGQEVREQFDKLGITPAPMQPEEFGRFVREQIATYQKIVKLADIQPQ